MKILGLFESMIDSGKPTIEDVGRKITQARKFAFCDYDSLPSFNVDEFIRYMNSGRLLFDLPCDNCLFSTVDGLHMYIEKEDEQRIRLTLILEEINKDKRYYRYCPSQVICDFSSPGKPQFKTELYHKARQIKKVKKDLLKQKEHAALATGYLMKCLSMLTREDAKLVTVVEPFPDEYPADEYEECLTYQLVLTSDPKRKPDYYTLEQLAAITGTTCAECEVMLKDAPFREVPA